MSKFFAAIAVLSVLFGSVSVAVPAHASQVFLHAPNQNEGANSN